MAERDSPAVALVAAGGGPAGLASWSEAPANLRGLPTPKGYPRYGFLDVELGSVWKTMPVEMYVRMEREAEHNRELARRFAGQKFCKKCGRSSWFEGMTDECCLARKGKRCNMTLETGQTSTSMPAIRRIASPTTETRQAWV